jgi:hypothetical protein
VNLPKNDEPSSAGQNGAEEGARADTTTTGRALSPAAQRALAEAEERRRAADAAAKARPREVGGREGPDPVRYGDWEKGGIASDF